MSKSKFLNTAGCSVFKTSRKRYAKVGVFASCLISSERSRKIIPCGSPGAGRPWKMRGDVVSMNRRSFGMTASSPPSSSNYKTFLASSASNSKNDSTSPEYAYCEGKEGEDCFTFLSSISLSSKFSSLRVEHRKST